MSLLNPRIKLHQAAFSGPAVCPKCHGANVRLLETIGHYVYRWQCKACFQTYREDFTPPGFYGDEDIRTREVGKPYASFKGLEQVVKPPPGGRWNVGVHKYKR